MTKLDRVDQKLLRLLQSDGRLTNVELAKQVHISQATCHRRVQRLFDDGFIHSINARIAPEKVERGVLVFVGVVLDRSTPESFEQFEQSVTQLGFVLDCHLVAGDFDYMLKIRVRDIAGFNRLHGEQLIALPGVRQARTFFVLKEVIEDAPLEF